MEESEGKINKLTKWLGFKHCTCCGWTRIEIKWFKFRGYSLPILSSGVHYGRAPICIKCLTNPEKIRDKISGSGMARQFAAVAVDCKDLGIKREMGAEELRAEGEKIDTAYRKVMASLPQGANVNPYYKGMLDELEKDSIVCIHIKAVAESMALAREGSAHF